MGGTRQKTFCEHNFVQLPSAAKSGLVRLAVQKVDDVAEL